MKILVTAATEAEIALSIKDIAKNARKAEAMSFDLNGHGVTFAITGVGMVATAYHLTRLLAVTKPGLAIQIGIAGSFDRDISLGETLFVRSERFADMGAEDGEGYIDVFGLGLVGCDEKPFTDKALVNPYIEEQLRTGLPTVDAITLNTVTGSETGKERLATRCNATLESMEGAAFHYVCLQEQVKFAQVRAVSNYIERRNRGAWQIEKALTNLNRWLVQYLLNITS